jgi:hypothetical protein
MGVVGRPRLVAALMVAGVAATGELPSGAGPTASLSPLRLRGGSGIKEGFLFGERASYGAVGPPYAQWTTNSDYQRRLKPDGTLKSDSELRREEHPAGYHPWWGDLTRRPFMYKDCPGFCSSDLHIMEALYGRVWFDSDYMHDDNWAGCRSAPNLRAGIPPPSDGYLVDDHYETSLRDEPLHESLGFRKPARVGQWLDIDGDVQLDFDGSLTNINGANIRDAVRCCNSQNLVLDRTDTLSALDGMEIPLGLSLNAVTKELNEDTYTLMVREATGAEPDLMLCHREEEVLELRLQAACEGIVEDQDGVFCWDTAESVTTKVHSLIKAGADFNWADDWGWTPLHCAVSNGNEVAVEALLEYLPALDLEIPSEPRGWTVLFRAVYRGLKDIVEMLLLAGANPWHIDKENMTAFEVAARYNSSDCMPLLRHFMGPEADQLNLEGLIEDQPIPTSFRQVPGPGVPRHLAHGEGGVMRKADLCFGGKRFVANLSTTITWTKEDEKMQTYIHEQCAQYRNKTGRVFYPAPEENPLNLRIPFPDHDKVFPPAGAASGDPSQCINFTALEQAEIIESDSESEESGLEGWDDFTRALRQTKGNHTRIANLFLYTGRVPPPNQTTRAEVYFGKRVLDPMDPGDLQKILYMNYGPEPGTECPPTVWTNYPEGRHNLETVFYSNQPGLVLNLFTFPCIGRDPRPPLLMDRVRHTEKFVARARARDEDVPEGRGTLVDVLGSRGVRCVVKWDESLPNGKFGGTNTTCDIGYKRRFTLELANTGQNKWEEDVLRKMEDLEWQGKLAPFPERISKEEFEQMMRMDQEEFEKRVWNLRHNATAVMKPDGLDLLSPKGAWEVPSYIPPEAHPMFKQ